MGILIFLVILVSSIVAVPIQRNQENDIEKVVTVVPEARTNLIKTDSVKRTIRKNFATKSSLVKDSTKKSSFAEKNATNEKSRKQKAFFLNNLGSVLENSLLDQNYQGKSNTHQRQESNVYYIKLPPSPYFFVPGLGYISQPPTYSIPAKLRPTKNKNQVPLVKVPIDFVSNGKPTSVYSYPQSNVGIKQKQKQSQTINLDKGPYFFNGNPLSLYLLDSSGRPTSKRTFTYRDYRNSV